MIKLLSAFFFGLLLTVAGAQVVDMPPPAGMEGILCAYNTVVPTPTAGKFYIVQCDGSGNVKVAVTLAANQSVNVAQINGVTPLMGNGVTGTGSQRVTIASDNTAFSVNAALPIAPLIASGNGVVLTPTTEAASAIAPSTAVAAAESCRVLQASAANLYKVTVAIAATTGYVMIFNATSAPGDGAVSPAWPAIRVVSDGTSGWADISFNPPLRLGTGATVCFSSTGPFTKTASATAAIGGLVK